MNRLINISVTSPKIAINTKNASYSYKPPQPSLNLKITKPQMEMEHTKAEIKMDNTRMKDSLGMKKDGTLIKEFAEKGMQTSMQRVRKTVNQGEQLAMPGANISEMERNNARSKYNEKQFGIQFIPERPEITATKGDVKINYTPGEVTNDVPLKPLMEGEYTRAEVDISLEQAGKVEIDYTGEPIYVGKSLDIKV